MSENILEKIIKTKIEKIDVLKKSLKIDSLKNKIDENKSFIDFKEKIESNINNDKISIIAEIKKASPSAGIIIDDYDPVNIAQIYNDNKATCLSVLTEEDFFLGNLIHITKIKQKVNQVRLQKRGSSTPVTYLSYPFACMPLHNSCYPPDSHSYAQASRAESIVCVARMMPPSECCLL